MKKLFALTLVLLLSVGVMADDAYIFTGDADGPTWDVDHWVMDTLVVSPNKWVSVPVWMMLGQPSEVADLCYALGIRYDVIDSFYTEILYTNPYYPPEYYPMSPPFAGDVDPVPWDVAMMCNAQDDIIDGSELFANPAGYKSLTFIGFAWGLSGPFAPFFTSEVPTHVFTFYVHTVDEDLIGQTFCDALQDGQDPMQPNNAGPPEGVVFDLYAYYSCVYFSPNAAPVIESFELPYDCGYTDFSVAVDIYDVDGDAIVIEGLTAGTIALDPDNPFTPDELPDEGITWHYILDFDMEDFCGECFSGDVILSINDGNEHPVEFNAGAITIVGEVVASMDDALWIWPGYEDWMPIYLDACGDCFCLGAFTFTVCYDASVLSITDWEMGAALLGGDYWEVNYEIEGPGTIRFFFINNLSDQDPNRDICAINPQEPIVRMLFLLNPAYEYLDDFCIPVCFCDETFEDNTVTDASGYHSWIPEGCDDAPDSSEFGTLLLTLECGNVKVMKRHNVVIGDLNLNGYAFEVGDVVVLANHLIDPVANPFTLRQMFASDVNEDDIQASIADLIYMINYIVNGGAGKVTPLDVVATVSMPTNAEGDVDVMISSETSVGGAIVSINHAGFEIGAPVAEGMDLDYTDNGEVMTVLVYDMEANSFAPGSNVLFTIPAVTGDLTFGDVSVSDNRGALLDARSELSIPLPTEFTVAQNYPNPFNAMTRINFTLPTEANVNINIYNVAGQLVESIDRGEMAAGYHTVVWDASDIASGIYFYRVVAGDHSKTMKMTLLK